MLTYEERLSSNLEWALKEGSIFFENRGAVQDTLKRIARRLDELGTPYVVVGGMALYAHGYRRFTEVVDIILSPESLKKVHRELEGRGYLRKSKNNKNLRDTENRVAIDFLVTGDFPGDGKQKPIAFPDPADVAVEIDGVRYAKLETLVCLKLACGMSRSDRGRDLSDVQELIKTLSLSAEFAEGLDPYVRDEYHRIWRIVNASTKRYVTLWRNKWLTSDATTLEEMAEKLQAASDQLQEMISDGVTLDAESGIADDCAVLVTASPETAKKYDMTPEDEYYPFDDEGPDNTSKD